VKPKDDTPNHEEEHEKLEIQAKSSSGVDRSYRCNGRDRPDQRGYWRRVAERRTRCRGQVTLYKNPECGCCEGYADYLRQHGFKVTAVPTNDLTVMGEKYGIPDSPQPCHISLIGGYVVGGHIPIEIINRLLSEKPQITGITLPGMPVGTPGMPGEKTGPLQIYEIGKGPPKVYATV
jgi:hypothetical protein